MNCVEFGFDRSRGFGSARGQFWRIAIDRPTRPYNIASTTVQQVIRQLVLTCLQSRPDFQLAYVSVHERRFLDKASRGLRFPIKIVKVRRNEAKG
jgi:hypothetical protein